MEKVKDWFFWHFWRSVKVYPTSREGLMIVQMPPRLLARIFNKIDVWAYRLTKYTNLSSGEYGWVGKNQGVTVLVHKGMYLFSVVEKHYNKHVKNTKYLPDPTQPAIPELPTRSIYDTDGSTSLN